MTGRDEREGLAVLDEDGNEVVLDAADTESLFAATGGLEAATVSACPRCRARVLACLALVDLLDESSLHPRAAELIDLADDAPTSHVYVQDLAHPCRHQGWIDPGRAEWSDVLGRFGAAPRT